MSHSPDSQIAHHHVVSPQVNGMSSQAYITRRLPLDVLHEIFFHTAQITQSGMPREESMLAALRLLQVCRTWRHVAMSCPSLWANITILLDGHGSSGRDSSSSRAVDIFLKRSRASPLSLSITCSTVPHTIPKFDVLVYILSKLLSQQNRWRVACFTFENVGGTLPEIRLANVPLLESLAIDWKGTWINYGMGLAHIDFSSSQKLVSLHTSGILIETSGEQLYGLKQVSFLGRHVEVRGMDHLEIIRKAPHLEFLGTRFILSTEARWDNPQFPMIMLRKLRTLLIDDSDVSVSLVSNIVVPALKHLICGPLNHGNFYVLVHLLKLTQPPLEALEITGPCTIQDLFILLRIFPDLQRFCMRGIYVTPDFFDMLSIADTIDSYNEHQGVSSILCPKLTELCLKNLRYRCNGKEGVEECIESLCSMLEKRCNALGVVGSIEYEPVEPLPVGEVPNFNVPFANIGCTQVRKALIMTKKLDVRFKKVLTSEREQNSAQE
ncbi:uncharacterized protein FOMMEDRAFT_152300 [Fomitiporia mediterranea MF3/22]|uniref:uncharacterized protein n=1 Tax=Fomitiporia mediterranea (strain MF3/22) TaxID=694068 RepID=UPI0004409307|nr:uncharacterized protein FOMMEDRAFT_152300 [Fomitiporia mediterranea MF3/22]EJD06960.1 hypothetical protein FOMMEDRAFT_152300 [Fomitiporia mediterranea MF3/22]